MHRSLPVIAIGAAFALAGCQDRAPADATSATPTAAETVAAEPTPMGGTATPTTPPVGQPAPAPEGGARLSSGDDLVLGMLGAVDEHEIAAARQAQQKNVTGAALDYAKMMEQEHTANLDKTKSLGTLAETPDVKDLKDKGAADLATLGQSTGDAYATAYIDAMIAGHQDTLTMIDSKMTAAASSDPVRQHLAETKTRVEQHLAKAREIKAAM